MFSLPSEQSDAGRRELLRRLRDANGLDITDSTRYFTVPRRHRRHPYRRGMLTIARATSRAERTWLRDMPARHGRHRQTPAPARRVR